MTTNAAWLAAWMRRMMSRTGFCGAALCESLAWVMGEEGEDSPSNAAVQVAQEWESEPSKVSETIRRSGRWCMTPSLGCMMRCEIWKRLLDGQPIKQLNTVKEGQA